MKVCDSAAVVGLGLVGGSLARELAARGVHVSAYDRNANHLAAAVREGVVHDALDSTLAGATEAEVIVIAVPVNSAVAVLRQLAGLTPRARLITDTGSTKAGIVAVADDAGLGDRFVGAHPMAGGHRSGWEASCLGLFVGAPVYLCPSSAATADARGLAERVWRDLGARPVHMDADAHDQRLAWTSHLPHIVSTALALSLAHAGVARQDLGPGGRDVTRLAGSSPEMWTAIAHENAVAIGVALAAAEQEIASFRAALGDANVATLQDRFTAARAWFEG